MVMVMVPCVCRSRPATRPGLVPADEFLLVDAKRNQKRLPNVHPCLRTPSLSTRCVHHSGVLNTPNRQSPDWRRNRPGMRKHAQTGGRRQAPDSYRVKDAVSFHMPEGNHCQSGDRRFGVLRTPERRTHRVGSRGVRRHGWTLGPLSWLLLSGPTERSDSPAGANTRRRAPSDQRTVAPAIRPQRVEAARRREETRPSGGTAA